MYEITVIDFDRGFILNSEAKIIHKDDDNYYPQFETFEEAEKVKNELLYKFVHVGVYINDLEKGLKGGFYFNEHYKKEIQEYQDWKYSFWRRIFTKQPKLKYYKPNE